MDEWMDGQMVGGCMDRQIGRLIDRQIYIGVLSPVNHEVSYQGRTKCTLLKGASHGQTQGVVVG